MTRSDSRKALGKGLHSLLPSRGGQTTARVAEPAPAAAEPSGERVLQIPIGQIHPNPHQPRAEFDEASLLELTNSIGRDGILQPIVARRAGPERYEIIAGERRWRAAKAAGLPEVPVLLREADESRSLELALIENIQREDLNPIELARAFERMAELGMTHDEIGIKTGKDRATVTNALRLLQLPEQVQGFVVAKKLSSGHARALLKLSTESERREVAERCIGEGWSVRQIEEYTRPNKSAATPEKVASPAVTVVANGAAAQPARVDPNVRAVENELQDVFGTKVRIVRRGGGRGHIEVEYYSEEDLQRLYEMMMTVR